MEHPQLMHIGGVSHYFAPREKGGGGADVEDGVPDDTKWPWPVTRLEVARFTAAVLRALDDNRPPPALPDDVDDEIADRLTAVRDALIETVTRYREAVGP
jgi:hypothetical protein